MELLLEIFPENVTYENANKEKKKISIFFNIIVVIKRHRDNEIFHCEAKGYIYMRHTTDITYMPSIGVIS